jgi:ABC-2 type transport system permease protein
MKEGNNTMNIYFHELKAYRKTTIIWTLSLVVIVILFMSMFPTISKDADEFKKLLEGYPEGVRKAIGLNLDSFASLLGFYSYIFVYIALCGAIQAMNIGTAILSKEVREKTADFLLTKPVKRVTIITSKILAALTSLIFTNIIYIFSTLLIFSQIKDGNYNREIFYLISLSLFLIQVIYLAVGIFISVVFLKIKSVISVSLGTVFTTFIIGMLGSSADDKALKYMSPFKYFEPNYIMENSSYETSFLFTCVVLVLVLFIGTYVIYTKKDINTI